MKLRMANEKEDASGDSDINSFEIIENKKKKIDQKSKKFSEKNPLFEYMKNHKQFIGFFTVIAVLLIVVFFLLFKCTNLQKEQDKTQEMMSKLQEEIESLKITKEWETTIEPINLKDLPGEESTTRSSTTESPIPIPPLTFEQLLPVYIAMGILIILTFAIALKSMAHN